MNEQYKPFDSVLLALLAESGNELLAEEITDIEAATIFGETYSKRLAPEKAIAMIASLAEALTKDTLGSLVTKAVLQQAADTQYLLAETGLTPTTLTDLKEDNIFTNSIPVKSLAKLLKALEISLQDARHAIQQTFEKLTLEGLLFSRLSPGSRPAFRKGSSHKEYGFDVSRFKSDQGYLFQNKEALGKYEQRLSELYNEL